MSLIPTEPSKNLLAATSATSTALEMNFPRALTITI